MTRKMRVELDRENLRELIAYVYSERPAAERATLLEKACRDPLAQTDRLQLMAVQRESKEWEEWQAKRAAKILKKLGANRSSAFAYSIFAPPLCSTLYVYAGVPTAAGGVAFFELEMQKKGFCAAEIARQLSERGASLAH